MLLEAPEALTLSPCDPGKNKHLEKTRVIGTQSYSNLSLCPWIHPKAWPDWPTGIAGNLPVDRLTWGCFAGPILGAQAPWAEEGGCPGRPLGRLGGEGGASAVGLHRAGISCLPRGHCHSPTSWTGSYDGQHTGPMLGRVISIIGACPGGGT